MTFAAVLDEKASTPQRKDFGAMFRESGYRLWHANLAARRALRRGVPATLSGTPEYNAHANDIDFQIEADFIGLMAPGLPQASNDICWRVGRVMNHGDGIYGGMFASAMYSAAFFESDPEAVVRAGLAASPPRARMRRSSPTPLPGASGIPDDWTAVWSLLEEKWNKREACPKGSIEPFNIDAKLNGAYIALGLLYGERDFAKTMVVAMRGRPGFRLQPGQRRRNPRSHARLRGDSRAVEVGHPAIEDKSSATPTSPSRRSLKAPASAPSPWSSARRAARGRPPTRQEARAAAGATGAMGRLRFTGRRDSHRRREVEVQGSLAAHRGEAAPPSPTSGARPEPRARRRRRLLFEGTGVILSGPYMANGGMADVHLDGELHRTIDVYSDGDHYRNSEAVWHAFGLPAGEHVIRLVVRGEAPQGSQGNDVRLENLIVFR